MGNTIVVPAAVDTEEPPDVLYVNDRLRGKAKGFGFARTMFSKKEWRTLKKFCILNKVTQIDLNRMYNRYLNTEAATVRKMRILITDISDQFSVHSEVYQDMAGVLLPSLFLRDYEGLKDPYSSTEISFARCVILGYMACLEPISDLIYDFFSISRRVMNVKVMATVFAYNFKQCVKVFCSELKPSATRRFLLEKCIREDDEELTILSIMQMGTKYPMLFYQLHLFQRHFKRLIFGDKFWSGREAFPTRFAEADLEESAAFFANEKSVIKETARQILSDFSVEETERPRLYWSKRDPISSLSEECCIRVKHLLGYRWARALIEESELEYPPSQCFADTFPDVDDEVRIYDNKIDSDFVYNVGTGYRAWVEKHRLRSGEVIKELWHRTGPDL